MSATPAHYAVLSAVVLGVGLWGVLSRGDALGVLSSLVVLFLAPVIALVGFAHTGRGGPLPPTGDALALFAVVAVAAEAATGVGVALLLWRRLRTTAVDDLPDEDG